MQGTHTVYISIGHPALKCKSSGHEVATLCTALRKPSEVNEIPPAFRVTEIFSGPKSVPIFRKRDESENMQMHEMKHGNLSFFPHFKLRCWNGKGYTTREYTSWLPRHVRSKKTDTGSVKVWP